MILEIETLTREDLESKMFLIKDYREYNSKEDKFQVMVVPKSRRNRSLDYETSDDQENSNRLQRQRVNAGQCQSGYRVSNLEGQNWLFLGQTLIHLHTRKKLLQYFVKTQSCQVHKMCYHYSFQRQFPMTIITPIFLIMISI